MSNKEEKILEEMKAELNDINIPDQIDLYIKQGILNSKKKRVSRLRPFGRIALIAACLLLTMLGSIRFSPTVAAYVGQLPFFDSIVKLVTNDKGLKLALDNDFIQPLGVSDKHDGVTFTIDAVTADESRILLFYSMEDKVTSRELVLEGLSFKNEKGENWSNFSVSYGSGEDGIIDLSLGQGQTLPESLQVEVQLAEIVRNMEESEAKEVLTHTWEVGVPLDKEKLASMKEVHHINEEVVVEGQKINFNKMTVYPTRIALEIEFDPTNKKKIFSFEDLTLVDEKGDSFSTIANGTLATHLSEHKIILYFQSNYFTKPENIFIEGSTFGALDKEKLEVEVDLSEEKLLKAPDERLTLTNIDKSKEGMMLEFNLKREGEKHYGVFSSIYKDALGKEYHSAMSSQGGGPDGNYQLQYYLEDAEYTNPVILSIDHYPAYIKSKVKIKVK